MLSKTYDALVAAGAPEDKARGAAIAGDIHQEIACHGGSDIAVCRNHEHIARLGFGERGHEGQVVERPAVACQRDADHGTSDKRLDPPVEGSSAVHGVDDEAGWGAKAFDDIGRRAFDRWGENDRRRFLDHGQTLRLVGWRSVAPHRLESG